MLKRVLGQWTLPDIGARQGIRGFQIGKDRQLRGAIRSLLADLHLHTPITIGLMHSLKHVHAFKHRRAHFKHLPDHLLTLARLMDQPG